VAENPAATSNSKDASDENFISFDAGTLASLTQNIEARLKGDKKNTTNNQGKFDKNGAKEHKSPAPKPNRKGKAEKSTDNKNSRPVQNSLQGKKRDHNGAVIEKTEKADKARNPQKSEAQDDARDDDDVLRKEILALGGSKEDFDLLAGVESDSEVEDTPKNKSDLNEDALRKELSKLLEGSGQYQAEIPDNEVAEEEEDAAASVDDVSDDDGDLQSEVDEESGSTSDMASTAGDTSKKSIADPQPNTFPKEYSRLVRFPTSLVSMHSR